MKSLMLGLAFASANVIPGSTITYQAPTDYQVVVAEVSAYTSSVDETDDTPHITASGSTTREGVLACPGRFKFGTKIEIDGKLYSCEDRMGKRYRDKMNFDVWMDSKEVAYQWGRKTLEIKIYE